MVALSADRVDSKGKVDGRTQEGPIKNAITVYRGSLLCWDANGDLIPGAVTAGLKFAGACIRGGLGVADGSVVAIVERRGTRWYKHATTATAAMRGKLAYVSDDNTVTDTAPGTPLICGKIVDVDTTLNMVEIDLQDKVA